VSGRLYFHLERCHYDENTLYSNFASQWYYSSKRKLNIFLKLM